MNGCLRNWLQIKKIVILKFNLLVLLSFPGGSDGKESACNAGGMQSINPWVRKTPGGGISNPPQYSCLEKPMDRGAWWATVHGVAKSQTDWEINTSLTLGNNKKSFPNNLIVT